ncbi:MAG: acetyl-CoA carboxylase biotin carboxyl carrier protein [Sphingomonadales bacterium]|nr:acetyl-CoA carboxylase biotin carboxyl carrier protein [Sphingomonadales bacterium]
MNIKEIQDLIRFVAKSGVTEVELEKEGFKLVIKATGSALAAAPLSPSVVVPAPVAYSPAPVAVPAAVTATATPPDTAPAQPAKSPVGVLLKSPMIGTFYRSSGPDKEPFVKVGDQIEKGQVICIVEAMKLFNEIEAEQSGTITKVLVENSSPVEYDQPLFEIDPS